MESSIRWFHCTTPSECFGFAINEHNIIVQCSRQYEHELMLKNVRRPEVREWFTKNTVTITEIKANGDNDKKTENITIPDGRETDLEGVVS
jgi:hypothetical protein